MVKRLIHYGYPVIVEDHPITLIKIPAAARMERSVFLHPRYFVRGQDCKKIQVTGLRLGRSIDILLDEPIVDGGKEFHILNVKGVGADAHLEQYIQPFFWIACDEHHTHWKFNEGAGRTWGAITAREGRYEMTTANKLERLELPFVPHLCLNVMPRPYLQSVCEFARQEEKYAPDRHSGGQGRKRRIRQLCQLTRALKTNIRLNFAETYAPRMSEGGHWPDPYHFARIDANVIGSVINLAKNNKTIRFYGQFVENRYIDGRVTDAENFEIESRTDDRIGEVYEFIAEYVAHAARMPNSAVYLKELSDRTTLPFSAGIPLNDPLWNAIEKTLGKATKNEIALRG